MERLELIPLACHSNVMYMPCDWLNVKSLNAMQTDCEKRFSDLAVVTHSNGVLTNYLNAVFKCFVPNRAAHHYILYYINRNVTYKFGWSWNKSREVSLN